jgi:hypothetical protein
MTLAQREHPEAVTEFDAAVYWYEEQQPGIGLALIDRAREARKDLDQWPNAAQTRTIAGECVWGVWASGGPLVQPGSP